jgi:hypothetical protein
MEKTENRPSTKLLASEELASLLNRTLEILYAKRLNGKGGDERYQMFTRWYNRINDIKLEMAGILGFEYHNPAASDW